MVNAIALPGCTPEPLMGYLKALGLFRLVATQADPAARLSWANGVAVLHTTLDRAGLLDFFVNRYCPTPVLAPWNGGGGFQGGGEGPVEAVARGTSPRFAEYRDTITALRQFPPMDAAFPKERLLERCRNELPDAAVAWLDACVVLGEERVGYFALLGTGGNDGRLDFTSNFLQRLEDVIALDADADAPKNSDDALKAALFADTLVTLTDAAVGQFNPGGVGGPNGGQRKFEAASRVNPWDFVLMVEGALLFAGSVARRLNATGVGRAAFPFTVESVAVGYGSSAAKEETSDGSRAELWLPLWDRPFTFPEARQLFGEGRAQLGRRQAKNAVEFGLAVNLLGVSRGVTAFARYGFLKRNGLAFLASPLGRVPVTPRPQARLLDDPSLRDWVDRLRRACNDKDKTPARYQAALRDIDRATFAFAVRSESGNDAKSLVEVLRALGRAERTLAKGLAFCADKFVKPLAGLSADWLALADDGSDVFRLAASLAGVRGEGKVGPMRAFLEEVEAARYVNWSPGSTSAVWSARPLADNLAAVFRRRQMEAFRAGEDGVPLACKRPARLDDVLAFLHGETDDDKLSDLLWGLVAVDWRKAPRTKAERGVRAVPFAFGVPRLVVKPLAYRGRAVPDTTRCAWTIDRTAAAGVKADAGAFDRLASGRIDAVAECVTHAAGRLKSGGLLVRGYRNRGRAGQPLEVSRSFDPTRLLAAMLFPLPNRDLVRIANAVLSAPESEE